MEACETPFITEKPSEELEIPPPPRPRKRRKLYRTLDVEKGDPLNDVISVSGIDLKEEQERLFYGPTKRPSPAFAQEENEAIMLQKIPLGKKLEQIMFRCGIANMSAGIEHCLSLVRWLLPPTLFLTLLLCSRDLTLDLQGVEEIMHRLIRNMIKVSKKRLDFEKTKHEILVTSDIRRQIGLVSQKVQYGEKVGKDQGGEVERVTNKRIQAAAANFAARTAVRGEDYLAKWQVMAQKASQRQDTSTRPTKEKVYWLSQTSGRSIGHLESHEGSENAGRRDIVENLEIPGKVVHVVSKKDVIAVLEKEPQFSKSTIYCLHEKFKASATANRLNKTVG